MLTTKVTKKGQITIPIEYRKEFKLDIGTVIEIKKSDNGLLIKRPKEDIMDLKGAWKDVPEKVFKDMKKSWGKWNEKPIARF